MVTTTLAARTISSVHGLGNSPVMSMPTSAKAGHRAQQVGAVPDDREIGQQQSRDAGDVKRVVGDLVLLQRKETDDGEQQPVERPRSDPRQERRLVPVAAPALFPELSGEVSG